MPRLTSRRIFAKLNVAYFARKYPAVQDAFLKSILEVSVRYHKTLAGEEVRGIFTLVACSMKGGGTVLEKMLVLCNCRAWGQNMRGYCDKSVTL